MLVVLKPLHDVAVIEHINVATYQSVSGAGREAIAELATQSAALLSGRGPVKAGIIPRRSRSMSCRRSTASRTMATPVKR